MKMITENDFFKFHPFSYEENVSKIAFREGEKKIGENLAKKESFKGKFVILGVEEDFGPQHNFGRKGADKTFDAFLNYFLNRQSNDFLYGDEFLIVGSIRPKVKYEDFSDNKNIIEQLDEIVYEISRKYMAESFIPIVIGGGHNNAFPLIKAANKVNKKINIINLDAHADLRLCDYRHSGNPFSWAIKDKIIDSYTVLGLHQAYNNQYIIDKLKRNKIKHSFFEDYIEDNKKFKKDVIEFIKTHKKSKVGIELDMDCIEYFPSSATSPIGFSLKDVRKYINTLTKELENISYFHISESAPNTEEEKKIVGKTLTYLISDFINNLK